MKYMLQKVIFQISLGSFDFNGNFHVAFDIILALSVLMYTYNVLNRKIITLDNSEN